MNNYLSKKYQEKADNQLLLIKYRKQKIRKNLYMMHFLYLSRLRSEIYNFVKKGINSLKESSNALNNSNKKEMRSLLTSEINSSIKTRMPFITIEQLILIKYPYIDTSLKVNDFLEKDLDLDFNYFHNDDDNIYSLNPPSSCKYYRFMEENEMNSSVNLDELTFKNDKLFDSNNISENLSCDFVNHENLSDRSLQDSDKLKIKYENIVNIQITDEISNLLNWSECLDFSLSCQLREITSEINNILFIKNIIKKKISGEFLDYVSDNNFLVANPFPFINLFDLNNKHFINYDELNQNLDFSKIYFFNLNITEIEFFDMNLNIIRNKITDLKYQLNLLIKKEKYWNNKKLCTKRDKSIINKI